MMGCLCREQAAYKREGTVGCVMPLSWLEGMGSGTQDVYVISEMSLVWLLQHH